VLGGMLGEIAPIATAQPERYIDLTCAGSVRRFFVATKNIEKAEKEKTRRDAT
jgi:hypothetical protein